MYNATERMQKVLAASAPVLARIDAVLDGTDTAPTFTDQDTRLVTFTDAAKRLNVSRPTVYMLIQKGELEACPLNGVNRIVLRSIYDYIERARKSGSRAGVVAAVA